MLSKVIKLIDGRDDVTLTTYVLDDSNEMLNKKSRPAVIVCPGGAYLSCGAREGEPVALAFARMGYHAFVLRYSVALTPEDVDGWDTDLSKRKPSADKMHPHPMLEIGMAFKCLDEHKDEWLVDMNRVAICGFSAGGHNCAMYATHWARNVISDYFKNEVSNLKPAACILGYPLTDYVYMNETTTDPKDIAFFERSNRLFLGEDWNSSEKLLDASPARLVDENTPPTFIWSTSKDGMVPVEHSTLYATALAKAKIPFELHIFQDGDHGMSLCDQSSAGEMNHINAEVQAWVPMCEKWLRKYLGIF